MSNPVPESTRPAVPERPMRPMDPAELVSKAEELFATFEPAKMSLDAHADAKIEEWRVRDPEDAVFLRQVLYGVTRYARFLGVVVRAFMHHNAATVLRRDKNTYTMYAYLALLRLDELGFQQFRCAFGWMAPSNTVSLVIFALFSCAPPDPRLRSGPRPDPDSTRPTLDSQAHRPRARRAQDASFPVVPFRSVQPRRPLSRRVAQTVRRSFCR